MLRVSAALLDVVRRFRGQRVVVLGDLVSDEFVYGDIARISREAPVLILEHRRTAVVPGGAGNAVANLRALGAQPIPVGVVGRDEPGRGLVAEFRRRGIDCAGVLRRPEITTPCKTRVLAGGVHTRRQQIVRIDRGGGEKLPRQVTAALGRAMRLALKRADGVLIADYGYGAATPEGTAALLNRIRRRGIPVTVDSRSRVAQFEDATACTPNQEEVERALKLSPLADEAAVEVAGRKLLRRTGNQAVLMTRGAGGMSLFRRRARPDHIPAHGSDEVADVTGAGDTVIAVFTLALLAGADFADAARLSNYAAGLVVMKAGTATISPDELTQAISEEQDGGKRR